MNREAMLELRALEDDHWWFRARRAAIRAHVDRGLAGGGRRALLDVGSGTGANLAWLCARLPPEDAGRCLGLEADPLALELAAGRELGARFVRADVARLPLAAASADFALCCDVLEHVEDDGQACAELARVLAPGGVLVVTVPAGPGLWSVHDEALGHRRRYRPGELEARLDAAGFSVESSHGFNLAPWPLVWAVRRWRRALAQGRPRPPTTDFHRLPRPVNALLAGALGSEATLLRALGLRRGVSLVVRARRR